MHFLATNQSGVDNFTHTITRGAIMFINPPTYHMKKF